MSHLRGDPGLKLMGSTVAPYFPGKILCSGLGPKPGSTMYLLVTLVTFYLSPPKDGIKSSPAVPYFDYGLVLQDKKPNDQMWF